MWLVQQHVIPKAQFGGRHAVTMLPGGGIGPELMLHVREIFGKIGVPVDFELIDINPSSEGNDDLEYAIISIKRNGVAIKGLSFQIINYITFLKRSKILIWLS